MPNQSLEFSTDDISIGQDGRVVINNPRFAKSLVTHLKAINPGAAGIFDNCNCKGTLVRAIDLKGKLPASSLRFDPASAGIFDNCNCGGMTAAPVQDV